MKEHLIAYKQTVAQIKKGIYETANSVKGDLALRQFYIVTANFLNFYPKLIKEKGYQKAFLELMWKRRLAVLDEATPERVYDISFTGKFDSLTKEDGQAKIFCAYHLGSYRAIIGAMARFGKDFTLVVNKGVYENQKESITETVRRINELCGVQSDFEILNAEEFDTAMQMMRTLKNGKSIIAYVDGNTGTGGAFRKDEKMLKVNFMGQPIFARQGISYISFLSNAPIVPVISYRNADIDIILEFFNPIDPADFSSRKTYCKYTTEHLYDVLEQKIKAYPLQYEAWLYLHKYLDVNDENRTLPLSKLESGYQEGFVFNHFRYGIFRMGEKPYLFDRFNYQTYELGDQEFAIINTLWHTEEGESCNLIGLQQEMKEMLITNKIILNHQETQLATTTI